MGLSASQGRMLLLTARKSDLEYRAQQISQKRLMLSQQLEAISMDYENATSNRQMKITTWLNGVAKDSDNSSKTTNLTYAALVSGTVLKSSALTGIQAYDRTEIDSGDYAATTPYRLVDTDGAIVISDVSEIPVESAGVKSSSKVTTKGDNLIYSPTTTKLSGTQEKNGSFVALSDIGPDYEGTALCQALFNTNATASSQGVAYDPENKIVELVDNDGKTKKYYNLVTGAEVKAENVKGNFTEEVDVLKTSSEVPKTYTETAEAGTLTGADGKYSLKLPDGSVKRYVVDESLKYGTSDSNGGSAGPNYLQDCIRNGKYLIQKGVTDTEDGDKFKWKNVAWDCIATIQDQYYQDDDDTAKAKYDRLQNEIQAQDKKLELELDNIETQRSAVTTEEESVKKVIDENIEGSFNAFG